MKKNKNARHDDLSSVDNGSKKIYKMYKSKKSWVVAPVILGLLAAGLGAPVESHAAEGAKLPVVEEVAIVKAKLDEAKTAARDHVNLLVASAPSFEAFKISDESTFADLLEAAADENAVADAEHQAYVAFPDVLAAEKGASQISTINGLKFLPAAEKKTAVSNVVSSLSSGSNFLNEAYSEDLSTAIANVEAVVAKAANVTAANAVVDAAVVADAKLDLATYKAFYVAKLPALTFLSATEQDSFRKQINVATTNAEVDTAYAAAVAQDAATEETLRAEAQLVVDAVQNATNKKASQDALDKAETRDAIAAAKAKAQGYVDAEKAAADLKAAKDELTAKIKSDGSIYSVPAAKVTEFVNKVAAAKTLADVEAVSDAWGDALVEFAEAFVEAAKGQVSALEYLSEVAENDYLASIQAHPKDVNSVLGIVAAAKAEDAANKVVVDAAVAQAKVTIAGFNLTDAQVKATEANLAAARSVGQVNAAVSTAKGLSDAADLAEAKVAAVKEVNALEYLVDKAGAVAKVNAAKTLADVDAAVAAAKAQDFKDGVASLELKEAKELAKQGLETLTSLTAAQKAQAIADVDAAKDSAAVQNVYNTAVTLNKLNAEEAAAAKALADAKAAANNTIDALEYLPASTKEAYKAEVAAATTVKDVKKVVDKAVAYDQELEDAADAFQAKKNEVASYISELDYLSNADKQSYIAAAFATSTEKELYNVQENARNADALAGVASEDFKVGQEVAKNAIAGLDSLTNAEKVAYQNKVSAATTKAGVAAVLQAAIDQNVSINDERQVAIVKQALKDADYAKAQIAVNNMKNPATQAAQQALLNDAKALSEAKSAAYEVIDGLVNSSAAQKQALKAEVSKLTTAAAVNAKAASLIKADNAISDAPWIALAEKLIRQGDFDGAKAAIAKVKDPDEKARLLSLLQADGWTLGEDGLWYFYQGGELSKGWLLDGGKWYFLDTTSGAMKTGWQLVNGEWYYMSTTSGKMLTGWAQIKGQWYFLDANGAMATGWALVNGQWYYLSTVSGAMKTGWLLVANKWYYAVPNGNVLVSTSRVINGVRYVFDISGAWVN
ncbi:KxYKxGKxW signal peptide domain-containing protein [Enterococcus timonensis]|uniref:KxYKxGKxW signal peptide domain-containing protein n=1 Tax=Enterococcus timonensis TaxID=1852364 RepID=UPI0008DA1D4D|nr:KxYKxGKxW signal peptide domain-containing protein [Enterococcus timonensis]